MKKLLLLAAVVVLLLYLGIVQFQKSAGKATITIDTDKAVQTTKDAVEKGKEIGSNVVKEAGKAVDRKNDEGESQTPERGERRENDPADETSPRREEGRWPAQGCCAAACRAAQCGCTAAPPRRSDALR